MRALIPMLVLGAVSATTAQQPPADGWANKMFQDGGKVVTHHDFGTVPKGAVLAHRFPVTNIYSVPLQITHVSVSCGCVDLKPMNIANNTLQPRQTGFIDVTMDTRRFSGPKQVTAYVTVMNQQQNYFSTATLTVHGNCRTDVVLNPGWIEFGAVPRGQTPAQSVELEYAGAVNWKLTPPAAHDLFDVQLVETKRQVEGAANRVGYKATLTLKPNVPPGLYKHEVLLSSNDPSSPTVPVPYDLRVLAAVAATPDVSAMGRRKPGEELSYPIIVKGQAAKPFRITAAEGDEGLSVVQPLPSERPRTIHQLTIKFRAGQQPGPFRKTLTLKTDLEDGSAATVTVEGTVVP